MFLRQPFRHSHVEGDLARPGVAAIPRRRFPNPALTLPRIGCSFQEHYHGHTEKPDSNESDSTLDPPTMPPSPPHASAPSTTPSLVPDVAEARLAASTTPPHSNEPGWDQVIRLGDCVAGMDQLEAGSADLIFADPPFNIGYAYDVYDDRRDDREYLDWSRHWIEAAVRLLSPRGSLWLAIGDDFAADLKVLIHRELGLIPRGWIVWYYTFGVHCERKFTRSHTHLLYFTRHPRDFTFHADAIRVPSARQLVYNDKRANPQGRIPDDTWVLRPQDLPDAFGPEETVWHVPRVCGTFRERRGWHGCQMPERILGRILAACSNPGDLVLDPFVGSGTTLAVARKLNRRGLGFELSADYAANAQQRLDSIRPGDPLDGGDGLATTAKPRAPRASRTTRDRRRSNPLAT